MISGSHYQLASRRHIFPENMYTSTTRHTTEHARSLLAHYSGSCRPDRHKFEVRRSLADISRNERQIQMHVRTNSFTTGGVSLSCKSGRRSAFSTVRMIASPRTICHCVQKGTLCSQATPPPAGPKPGCERRRVGRGASDPTP